MYYFINVVICVWQYLYNLENYLIKVYFLQNTVNMYFVLCKYYSWFVLDNVKQEEVLEFWY